ncbi:MAG: oxalate/formate MFS antiporter [Planctomycetes bacterium]|nr:oxalate/formate MFS antiporter [Planctomycetota bacterium]
MIFSNRWVQLATGITGMVAVANFQYSWTFFVVPLQDRHGWEKAEIQYAFYLFFVQAQTWLVPLEGYLAERFGPRKLLFGGGILAGLGWIISAETSSLELLYAGQALSGCGSGIVYSVSMGSALKWFPDRRGLAAGLMAAAFGAGAAGTVRPVRWTILHYGYDQAFVWFGIGQALVIILATLIMRFPRPGEAPAAVHSRVLQSGRDFTPLEMLRCPAFWLIYLMMTLGAIPGLLMIGHIDPLAREFGVAAMPVTFLWFTSAALPLAVELDRVMGGLTRPVFGWISDYIGREIAIFLAFSLEGIALFFLIQHAQDPILFVLMSGLAFFGWGAVFSLFPAVSGDMFGRKFATTNYSLLYTAKGAASLLVALCDVLRSQTESWVPVFAIMIAADAIAALLALLVLRPLRTRLAKSESAASDK